MRKHILGNSLESMSLLCFLTHFSYSYKIYLENNEYHTWIAAWDYPGETPEYCTKQFNSLEDERYFLS